MSLLIPPSTQFATVFRAEAAAFVHRQDAFVASVIEALGSTPPDLLPAGNLLLEDYRADETSDGYLRFLGGTDGKITVLVEVACLRRSGWFRGSWYEVMANVGLPDDLLRPAWDLLQTGAGLEGYSPPPADKMPFGQLASKIGRPVIGNMPGARIRLQ
jgi:hypothetical protein